MELFRLFGSIMIDDKDAIAKLNNADKKASSVGNTFGKIAGGAAKVGSAVLGVGTIAATALTGMAMKTAETSDRIDEMSQALGLTKKGFQEWDYILGQNGVSIDSMGVGMKKMALMMTTESDKSSAALKKIGLSFDDISKMSQEDAFSAIVTGMQGMKDGADKAALSTEFFGKSGMALLPILNAEKGSIDDLKKTAHEMNMVMSDESVKAGAETNDMFDTLTRAGTGLFNKIGSALMPVINTLIDVIVKNMPMIQGVIEKLTPIVAKIFEKLLPPIMKLVETLFPVILDLLGTLMPIISELFEAFMPIVIDIMKMLLPPIMDLIKLLLPLIMTIIRPLLPLLKPLLALLQPFIDLLMLLIVPLVELLNMVLPPLVALLVGFYKIYLPLLTAAFKLVANIVGGVFKNVFNGLKPIFENVKNIFQGIMDFVKNVFTGNWKGAWQNIVNIFKNIFSGIANIAKFPINLIIDGINTFTRGISKIKIPDWVPVIGGKGFNIPSIPRLKVGLDYVPYDEFPAILHKGERVMTARENQGYVPNKSITLTITNFYNNRKEDIEEIAQELEFYINQKNTGLGGAYNG